MQKATVLSIWIQHTSHHSRNSSFKMYTTIMCTSLGINVICCTVNVSWSSQILATFAILPTDVGASDSAKNVPASKIILTACNYQCDHFRQSISCNSNSFLYTKVVKIAACRSVFKSTISPKYVGGHGSNVAILCNYYQPVPILAKDTFCLRDSDRHHRR